MAWPTWATTTNNGEDGKYWKELSPDPLGRWVDDNSLPTGINSVFPKLWWEED